MTRAVALLIALPVHAQSRHALVVGSDAGEAPGGLSRAMGAASTAAPEAAGRITGVSVTPDGRSLLATAADGTATTWTVP